MSSENLARCDAEFRENLSHNGFDQPLIDYAAAQARRIYVGEGEDESLKTRNDVRTLCRCLGVNLKEPPHA